MQQKFSFEGAISAPFKTAHFGSFPWVFALAYSVIGTLLFMAIMFMARGAFMEMVAAFEVLDQTIDDSEDAGFVMGAIFGAMSPLLPYFILGALLSWVFWSVFQAASMRRYVRDEPFYLRFGADEVNTMIVAIGWWLLGLAFYAIPMMLIFGGFAAAINSDFSSTSEEALLGSIFGALGIMVLLFPVYVFFATRLAPAFGLTIKDGKARFFDAWNVSRGRFWPILGAFVIISIVGSIAASIVSQMFQMILMFTVIPAIENMDNPEDLSSIFTSAGFLIGLGVFLFASFFIGALQMHFNHGPAAFAARHDPRGSVDDVERLGAFD